MGFPATVLTITWAKSQTVNNYTAGSVDLVANCLQ
jgi:hypothetical protein